MKSSSGTSSKKKRAALNVKKAVKIKKTAKRRRSSAEETARALTRAQKKLPVSRSSKPSSSGLRDNVAVKLFWIIISNIHEKVAYEDIVRAIFQRCVKLRSNSNPSNLGGHFQDTIEVAFETKEDAVKAVNLYQGRIRLFRKTWSLHHHKPSAASSSGLRISDIQEAAESSDKRLAKLKQTIQDAAVGTGDSARLNITNIHDRVPRQVVVPLFEIVGRVKSHEVFNNSEGIFQGTVELVYERSEDAVAAVRLFDENITFFGQTWFVTREDAYNDDADIDNVDDNDDDDDGDDNDNDDDNDDVDIDDVDDNDDDDDGDDNDDDEDEDDDDADP